MVKSVLKTLELNPGKLNCWIKGCHFKTKKVFGSCIAILHYRKAKPPVMPTNSV